MKLFVATLFFLCLFTPTIAKVFSSPEQFYRKGIERFLEIKPPQLEDEMAMANTPIIPEISADEEQLLADLPHPHEVARSETSEANALQFEDFRKPLSLMPVIQPSEFTMYSNPNPAFMLGNPGFIDQFPALNMINPQVSMSLLSPYLTYMNHNWVDPVKMNPFMLNPYFAPRNAKVEKGPNAIANSQNAFFFPNIYSNFPPQMPEPIQQEDTRLIRKV